ncbi:MAG: phosphatidylserine decarboxylase, partial [Sphingomonadales bacterium]
MKFKPSVIAPLHQEGHKFVIPAALVTVVLFMIYQPLGWIGVVLTAWCAYFFRDPPRVVPGGTGLVVSPADGRFMPVVEAPPPPELDMGAAPRPRIS